ncbi:MAG: energy-coupling factor ABC transporter permease [Verrucomicrobia bacterium]|nr:energy-coupling factor ABC transporter permease [Verrucomicrobiota bacterium]
MHIPDGFLDAKTAAATGALAVGGLALALRQVRTRLPRRRVPLMGLAAAFVFAAQMLNFPVGGGTSGHLVGGVLAAVLLGPSAAVVVMSAVLIVQCFLFADGGVLALGANVFNMAIVGTVGGYGIYRVARRMVSGLRGLVFASAFAGWCSTVMAALGCTGELAWSRTVSWSVVFPAMANIHMLISLGEALITALVVVGIARARPELVEEGAPPRPSERYGELVGFGVLITLGLALLVSPFVCEWPDGLEKVAATLGFDRKAIEHPLVASPLADYQWPGMKSAVWATALAGAIGTVVVFVLAFVLARVLAPKSKDDAPSPGR